MSELKDFDSFWLEKGQEMVNETFTNLNNHLKNYSVYLKALMGFYALIGLTTDLITGTTNVKVYLVFVLPYSILFLALFKISVGQSVSTELLDLRSPLKINDTYNELVLGLKEDIKKAKIWVALATCAVLVGGTISLYHLNKEKQEKESQDKIEKCADIILGYEDEALKDFIKTQKLKVSKIKEENKITVEAKFSEDKVIEMSLITVKDETIVKTIKVQKLCHYTVEISGIKQILNTKIK